MDKTYSDFCNYISSNLCLCNETDTKNICNEVINHKSKLDSELGRDIGIEVALLDYIKNINPEICIPDILNSLDIKKIYHSQNANKEIQKYYDNSVLSSDIKTEIERAHRYGSPFSILMFDISSNSSLDIDDFATNMLINIKTHLRLTDIIYTYHENRYVLILSETDINDAIEASYKIRNWSTMQKGVKHNSAIGVCIGIAVFGLYEVNNDHQILSVADMALRKAKESGLDSIYLFQGKEIVSIEEKSTEPVVISKKQSRVQFNGYPIHHGVAIGNIFIYNDLLSHKMESYDISDDNLEVEFKRIKEAIQNVEKDLSDMEHLVDKDLSSEYASIFQAHRLILNDNQLFNEIKKDLYDKKMNGEEIVRDVFKRWEKRFLAFEDEIFRNKSQDIVDISIRILKELQGIDSHILESVPKGSIIFANRMLPSDTVNLKRENIEAIVTKEGSRFSHMAILSKAMNIPLVIVEDLELSQFGNKEIAVVDGEKGTVIINPNSNEKEQAEALIERNMQKSKLFDYSNIKDLYFKGEKVSLLAAASNQIEIKEAEKYGSDGIGLFRMEVFYLAQDTLPSEETLINEIETILEPCKSKEIIIRLLDIGGDKNLPYINVAERYNSSLGMRGVRLFRKHPQLLETQLRALIKVNQKFNIKLLIPMVTLVDDILYVKNIYDDIRKGLKIEKKMPIGTMIETPASVLALDSILECSDFISIGSNDLIQYTVAADREKLSVSKYYDEGNIIIQDFIRIINQKSFKHKIDCNLCGELAQNLKFTKDLLDIGCRNFTIASSIIPSFREAIMQWID